MDCYGSQINLEEAEDKNSTLDNVFISSRVDNIKDLLANSFDYEEAMKKEEFKEMKKNTALNEVTKKRNEEKKKRDAEKRLEARKRRQMLIEQKQKIRKGKDAAKAAKIAILTAKASKPVQSVDPSRENIKNVQFFTKRGFCRVLYTIDGVKKTKGYTFTKYSGQEGAVNTMKNEFEKYLNQ